MKSIFFGLVIVLASQAFAQDCIKVHSSCLSPVNQTEQVQAFLKLEVEIGQESSKLHHVNQYRVFDANHTYLFRYSSSTDESLTALGKWAQNELGVYTEVDQMDLLYTGFDMLQSTKKLNMRAFEEFLSNVFMDVTDYQIVEDRSRSQADIQLLKEKLEAYKKLKTDVIKDLVDQAFRWDTKEVFVYDLLNNRNENVQDAEYVIVTPKNIIIMNRFWWL